MSFHLDHLRIYAALVVAALLLVGCAGAPDPVEAVMGPAAEPPPPDPLAGAPALYSCFRLTPDQARGSTDESRPVDCSDPHTSLTYHVGLFHQDALIADSSAAERDCTRSLARGLGVTPRQLASSVLDHEWFEPSTTQWSAGARWYRCDAVAWTPDGQRLKQLPSGTSFSSGVPDALSRCLRDEGESGKHVTCDRPHDYRWAGEFTGTGRTAPDDAEALEQAEGPCGRLTGAENWFVTWPSDENWAAGDHTMACYRPTGD